MALNDTFKYIRRYGETRFLIGLANDKVLKAGRQLVAFSNSFVKMFGETRGQVAAIDNNIFR